MRKLLLILFLLPLFASAQTPMHRLLSKRQAPSSGCDADALAWIAASGLIDTTGICNFFKALKDSAIWPKIQGAWIAVGTDATSAKFNIKNPADSDAAFRLTFSGSWSYEAGGMAGGGSGYANTHYVPSDSAIINNNHIASYNTVGVSNTMMGAAPVGTFENGIYLFISGGVYFVKNYSTGGSSENPTPNPSGLTGFFINNRTGSGGYDIIQNTTVSTSSVASSSMTSSEIYLQAMNQGGASFIGTYRSPYYSIGRGFSSDELRAYNNIIQQLITDRGL